MTQVKTGDIIEARVAGVSHYGIFVSTLDNKTGLIHISEISNYYVKNILDYVYIGENILCEVLGIDENNRLNLSIKNINYKLIPRFGKIKDNKNGFKPLQMKLPIWIREKLSEIKEENN